MNHEPPAPPVPPVPPVPPEQPVQPVQQSAGSKALAAVNPIGFWNGFTYVLKGARFVYFRHPQLIRIWILPILLSIIAIALAAWGSWTYSADLVDWLWPEPSGEGFFVSLARGLHSVVEIFVSAIIWFTSMFLVVGLSNVFAAPFNDSLSQAVEQLYTGAKVTEETSVLKDLGRTIWIELTKLLMFVGLMGPLLCCSFAVPGVGQVIYTVVGFVFAALYFAIDYIDWPAARRNKRGKYRWDFLKRRFAPAFGFGAGVFLLLFIPLLNLLFMPAAVAGGTLLFIDLEGAPTEP